MLQNYGAPTKQSYNPLMARKVLVVDDTKNIQLMLKEYLQNQGFEVHGVSSFRQYKTPL